MEKFMCRLVSYLGSEISISSLVTDPKHSIIHQSFKTKEREEPLNGDGFGIGWFTGNPDDQPAIFKDTSPAWNNMNLLDMARVTKSPCILAHVRAATVGGQVSRSNCHPFRWRNFAFMHNGTISDFEQIKRKLRQSLSDETYNLIKGYTDSEHIFALFADNLLKEQTHDNQSIIKALLSAITKVETLKEEAQIKTPSTMNIIITNGDFLIATRYSTSPKHFESLYYLSGQQFSCIDNQSNADPAILIASEPLSKKDKWIEVKKNHMIIARKNKEITIEEIKMPSTLTA
jgi:ergothioneine biosynthesis protein EgtC